MQVIAKIKNKIQANAVIQRAQINVFNVQPSGIAYRRPPAAPITTISYQSNDYAQLFANGAFDYTPPAYPLYHQDVDLNASSPFLTLKYQNKFGTYERFTDTEGKQNYVDGWIIDHLTGLEWCIGWFNSQTPTYWGTHLNNGVISYAGRTGRCPSYVELATIMNVEASNSLMYSPFNIDLSNPIGGAYAVISANTYRPGTNYFKGITTSLYKVGYGSLDNIPKNLAKTIMLPVRRIEKPLNQY